MKTINHVLIASLTIVLIVTSGLDGHDGCELVVCGGLLVVAWTITQTVP